LFNRFLLKVEKAVLEFLPEWEAKVAKALMPLPNRPRRRRVLRQDERRLLALAAAIRARQISAAEMPEAHLAQIAKRGLSPHQTSQGLF
jgi:hypothetical protein